MSDATPVTETTTTTPAIPKKPNIFLVTSDATGVLTTNSFFQKKDMAKFLQENPNLVAIAAFKGKKLNIAEKKSYSFS